MKTGKWRWWRYAAIALAFFATFEFGSTARGEIVIDIDVESTDAFTAFNGGLIPFSTGEVGNDILPLRGSEFIYARQSGSGGFSNASQTLRGLDHILQAGTYTYTYQVADGQNSIIPGGGSDRFVAGFYLGSTPNLDGANVRNAINSFHSGSGITYSLSDPTPSNGPGLNDGWELWTATVEVDPTSALVGQEVDFGVAFNSGAGGSFRAFGFDAAPGTPLVSVTAVPEPSSLALLGMSGIFVGISRRRRPAVL